MHTKETQDNHFIGNLEELGLTKYEAGAYLSLIQKGSCAPSEIAYHSNVPRTKIYSILKRLEKKQLCVLSQQKPLVFSPVPPAEAFHEILKLSERRVKNMKKIVDLLQGINDEVHKPIGSEERRYTLFNPRTAFPKINSLISGCKSRIDSSLDNWGIRLISQCRDSLIKAITRGVKIRLVVGYDCAGSEMVHTLPGDIDLKMGDVRSSIIIIDATNAVLLDSRNGKAAIFNCTDILGASNIRNVEEDWRNATKIKYLVDSDPVTALKAIKLTRIVQAGLLYGGLVKQTLNAYTDSIPLFVNDIEAIGIKISPDTIHEILTVVDLALKMSYSGKLQYDSANKMIIMQCKVENTTILPWAFLLFFCFKQIGCDAEIMQNLKEIPGETIHIKLSRFIL